MKVKFWGVRGSVATPLTSADIRGKLGKILHEFSHYRNQPGCGDEPIRTFLEKKEQCGPFTYGGNTSCVEVTHDNQRIVLDMGTGLRPLGNSLFKEMFGKKGLDITFLLSHVHWDHIQGLPFFGPLYINKETGIRNSWMFYGGTDWLKTAEACLQGQMDSPTFPVSWTEVKQLTGKMDAESVYDLRTFEIGNISVIAGKLNHPQETYGYRLTTPDDNVIVYTTDNEPYDPTSPDTRLLKLAQDADIWVTDCQYSGHTYSGEKDGVSRRGWGHSYPLAVAHTATQARVKKVILFHHDPGSTDEQIEALRDDTQSLINLLGGNAEVIAAWEGLEL